MCVTFTNMRIYLIGFMGTGKSTLGSSVAAALNVPFLDTDLMVEEKTNLSITDIFNQQGEDAFRDLEARVIRSTGEMNKALIATGGGLPVYHHNMQWLTEHGITMYLQWPEEILIASLVNHRSIRPLLAGLTVEEATHKATNLLAERKSVYEQASMTLDMTGHMEDDHRLLERACKYIW